MHNLWAIIVSVLPTEVIGRGGRHTTPCLPSDSHNYHGSRYSENHKENTSMCHGML